MDQKEFTIEQIKSVAPEEAEKIRNLTKQIGKNHKVLTDQNIKEMLKASCNYLFVVRDGSQIIAMVTLLIFRIPYVKKAYLDDLVVDESYRGQGLGKKLLEKSLSVAKEEGAAYIDFTSRPRRAANALYEKFGFEKRDTNVYRLNFTYDEV